MHENKQNTPLVISIAFAIWFALTAGAWTYCANLIISFPFGILSLIIWSSAKKQSTNSKLQRAIPIILIGGALFSLLTLIYFLKFD